jgi:hypothetical protein
MASISFRQWALSAWMTRSMASFADCDKCSTLKCLVMAHDRGGYRAVFLNRGYSTSLASCLPRPPMVERNDQNYMVPLRAFVTICGGFCNPPGSVPLL